MKQTPTPSEKPTYIKGMDEAAKHVDAASYVKVLDGQIINRPPHYTKGSMEVIDIIEAVMEHTGNNFAIGTAIKYICRHVNKGSAILDLEKSIWYLKREINKLERHTTTTTSIQGDTKRR